MPSVHEQLSEQFYKWEARGRGWQVFDDPVNPEPPFRPFLGHYFPETPAVDDGRRPTFLSSLFRKISQLEPPPVVAEVEEEEPEPKILVRDSLVELQTSLPADLDIAKEAFEQFLSNLSLCQEPIAFELLGLHKRVIAQFATHPNDAPLMHRQLQSYFPEAVFQPEEGALDRAWDSSQGDNVWALEFGLEREFMYPLAVGKLDPFIGIIGALSGLQPGELGLFQVLFQPVQNKWAESIIRAVTHADGKPFFVNAPELAGAAENKVARPLYAAVVRILVRTVSAERMVQIGRDITGSLRVFIHPDGNALVPLSNDDYPFEEHIADVLCRQSRRSGMLLNVDELIRFVHLPSSDVRASVLQRDSGKTKAAPSVVRQNAGVMIGNNFHAGQTIPVRLTSAQRVQHTHIIGASGTGKSTLLFNLIRQDIENGQGVAVLDPAGDLIERILGIIPTDRIKDVILVDPSDEEHSIGFNILSAHSQIEKNLLASDLVSLFQRHSTSWGDQMGTVLQNAILAFLENSRRGTISDMQRFLVEKDFRAEFLKTVTDRNVAYYWKSVFPMMTGNRSISPVITRLGTFLNHPPIRHMVSQTENRLNFADIMDNGKIFLAKLPEGLMGEEDSYLLGALLIAKFQQIAMSRQAQQMGDRRDFWIYVDEFDHFITPSMAKILKGLRKYRIGLTLAHHTLHQLQQDSDVASAVMAHPTTRIVFRVSGDDARKLADSFSSFEPKALTSLETFQAIARVERSDYDFNLSILPPENLDDALTSQRRQEVIRASREKYGTPREELEASLHVNLDSQLAEIKITPSKPIAQTVPKDSETMAVPHAAEVPKPPAPTECANADKGESEHTAIKNQIETQANSLDYTVTKEKRIVDGKRVDIVLERGARNIACEVSVTNTVEYEAAINITKCLTAGFLHVACICANRKKLGQIQAHLSQITSLDQIAKVEFYTPEEFVAKLTSWAVADPAGGIAQRAKPHKREDIGLAAPHMTEVQQKERERGWLAAIEKNMDRRAPLP